MLLHRASADFFGGHAEDGGRGDAEDAEVAVDLAAVMGFVLDHGAQAEADGRLANQLCNQNVRMAPSVV